MIEKRIIENTIEAALSTGADYGEVYLERERKTNISLVNGNVETAQSGMDYGAGIRLFFGNKAVYGFTNDTSEKNLITITKEIAMSAKGDRIYKAKGWERLNLNCINPVKIQPSHIEKQKKIEPLQLATQGAKSVDPYITQTRASYMDTQQEILIATSEGTWAEETRIRTRLHIEAIATKENQKQMGYVSPGASMGFEFFDLIDLEEIGRRAARTAVTMVQAKPCPKGSMPVVIDNGFGGVIFHEACGHGLEATSVAKNASVFAGKMGQQIASPLVTAIDDGTIINSWGSTAMDDEGTPTQRNVLIENGILKSYMVDKLNGRRMGAQSTGSSRRQSYRYAPTSRMTNTYIAQGNHTLEEMIQGVSYGLYAKQMGGGSVNPATGEFNFTVLEGYLIENGKITYPVQGATLIGKGIEVLQKIDMVGNTLAHAQGMCGSSSGSIPTNVGQPAIRVSQMTVGGRG